METIKNKKHDNWVSALCDGYIPAWQIRINVFSCYFIIEKFCDIKETFPVKDPDENVYHNVDFYNPRYVLSVFGLSDDRSFFKPDAKAYLDDIETLLNKSIN